MIRGDRPVRLGGGKPAPYGDPWSGEGRVPVRRGLDLLSLVPLFAIVALVVLVTLVIWIANRSETEQARTKLATDALWVEQTLRFQMSVDEDMLVGMSLDTASGISSATIDARARAHIAGSPEFLSVVWYDAEGRRIRALPGRDAPGDDVLVGRLAQSGVGTTRPSYGDIAPDGSVAMGLALPGRRGFVTATLSLPLLLNRHLPWWIAEQYGVRILDSAGTELAARQRLTPTADSPSHAISFDPPLRGVAVQINAYQAPTSFRTTLLMAAIGGLAIFAILALVILFRSAGHRRLAELRLRNETAFRRSMEESLTVGLRAKDHSGRILYVNSAFCNLVGWEVSELVGRMPPMPYWDPERLSETEARHREMARGPAVRSFETRFLHRDGHEIDVQVYDAPLIDAAGKHRGWMGSVIDITEQKRVARLARAQDETMARTGRLVTLGEMASTLAHELNQPLAAIASYAAGMQNLMDRGDADPVLMREANQKLARQADRAGQIIRRIQDLVKKREPRFSETRLDEVIAETVEFLQADAREHRVELAAAIAPVPPVEADRILLEQVLINLIRNGMEAMGESRSGDGLEVRLMTEAGHVVIEVADCGAGIAPELAGRLFDAFATTKPQGMGMGLKICRSIVELHGGLLTHRPGAGGGTVFRILLPLRAGAEKAA
ncbi:two-component system sensor histidine kinase NtrB [Paracoccus lutimaris]|uniref:histidine kinase n=1 Tax=Paracoccus lutimaris TaxID=1490030 RepID=A0A368Z3Y1_9RHOB|nr:PAS domain S-box protein [Paracoccus lutimaris]RCW87163.1 PAS/PAC sensor signal transduction histidine kinase [Paracoccus lutimaris]